MYVLEINSFVNGVNFLNYVKLFISHEEDKIKVCGPSTVLSRSLCD